MDGEIYFQTWIPNFWPIDLLCVASMARKITEPKFHLFMFSLDNVVESLGEVFRPGSIISVTAVEITFLYANYYWLSDVVWPGIYARFAKKMAES